MTVSKPQARFKRDTEQTRVDRTKRTGERGIEMFYSQNKCLSSVYCDTKYQFLKITIIFKIFAVKIETNI